MATPHAQNEPNGQRTRRRRRGFNQSGFTLVEAVVGTVLISLVFLGTMQLFIESQRGVQRTGVQVQASQDAAIGLQYVLSNARESWRFALPADGGSSFLVPGGVISDYQSSTGANTALEMVMPALTNYALRDQAGSKFTLTPGGYDRTAQAGGDILWVYRGDAPAPGAFNPAVRGNPNANSGKYLWACRRPAGATDATQDRYQVICKLILTKRADGTAATDAVQFGRPSSGVSSEIEVKIVSGDATSINGTQTNEATDGSSVNAMYGKCALMRNRG